MGVEFFTSLSSITAPASEALVGLMLLVYVQKKHEAHVVHKVVRRLNNLIPYFGSDLQIPIVQGDAVNKLRASHNFSVVS